MLASPVETVDVEFDGQTIATPDPRVPPFGTRIVTGNGELFNIPVLDSVVVFALFWLFPLCFLVQSVHSHIICIHSEKTLF